MDFARGLNAIDARHIQIHQNQIGEEHCGFLDDLGSAVGQPGHFDFRIGAEDHFQALGHDNLIVTD